MNIREDFDSIFRLYYPELVRYATTILKDEASSRDVVQELFINLYEKSDGLVIKTDLKYYLISGCRNRCLNYIRSGKTRIGHAEAAGKSRPNQVYSEESLELQDLQKEISKLIDSLPEKCAKIFRMNRFDGMRNAEIARELDISIRTVETQISKALKFLRSNLTRRVGWWLVLLINMLE